MRTTIVLKPWMRVVLVMSWLAVIVPVLTGTGATVPAAYAADSPGSITLHVQSARSVADGPGFVHKDDPITDYKWLVNVDDTGDPGTAADPGHGELPAPGRRRRQHRPRLRRHLPVALDPEHPGLRPDRGAGQPGRPQRLDGARQPARRQVPDLGHRRRLQDRRRALHRAARGHPARHRADEPDAAAADHDPDPGLRGPGTGGRDVRGGCGARAVRLHRPPHRRLRRGEHGLLRQPPVHRLPARRRRPGRPDRLRQRQPPGRRRQLDRALRERCRRHHQDPEPRPQPVRRRGDGAARPAQGLGADHHPGGRDRPRHLGAGGRDRPGQRGPQGRRARADGRLRLRPAARDPGPGEQRAHRRRQGRRGRRPPLHRRRTRPLLRDGLPQHQGGGPDQPPLGGPVRPRRRRCRDLRRSRQRQGRLRHPARAERDLPAHGVGRQPRLHPVELQRDGPQGPGERRRQQDDRRVVHPRARPRLHRLQRERPAGPRREVRPRLRPHRA